MVAEVSSSQRGGDRYELTMGEKTTTIDRCVPVAKNMLSNSRDWEDTEGAAGAGDEWTIEGAKKTSIKVSDNCATDGSQNFLGRYQRIEADSNKETVIWQGRVAGVSVWTRSEGCGCRGSSGGCGRATIKIDGIKRNKGGRGHNVVHYNPETEEIEARTFDTYGSSHQVDLFRNYLNAIPNGNLVAIACQDECCNQIMHNRNRHRGAINAMKALGITHGHILCDWHQGGHHHHSYQWRSSATTISIKGEGVKQQKYAHRRRNCQEASFKMPSYSSGSDKSIEIKKGKSYLVSLKLRGNGKLESNDPSVADFDAIEAVPTEVIHATRTFTAGKDAKAFGLTVTGTEGDNVWVEVDEIELIDYNAAPIDV